MNIPFCLSVSWLTLTSRIISTRLFFLGSRQNTEGFLSDSQGANLSFQSLLGCLGLKSAIVTRHDEQRIPAFKDYTKTQLLLHVTYDLSTSLAGLRVHAQNHCKCQLQKQNRKKGQLIHHQKPCKLWKLVKFNREGHYDFLISKKRKSVLQF